MRVILIFCVLIAAAVASPATYTSSRSVSVRSSQSSCDISYPKIIPSSWIVKTFKSQKETLQFQGLWHLQAATPINVRDQFASHTGLFSPGYPSSNIRVILKDTTPECSNDYNINYIMLDSSFNLATQCIEKTRTMLYAAYGSKSPLAIFTVATEKYYPTPLCELEALIDEMLVKNKCDADYERKYTVCVIGADSKWEEYMVIAVVNKYDNLFCGNDNHIIWVFTRDRKPKWCIYEKAMNDILKSGLNPNYLVKVDNSIILKDVQTVTEDDAEGVIEETTTVTETTTKSTMSSKGMNEEYSSTTTTTITTVSTVEFTLNVDYTIPYEYGYYDKCGSIKILKNIRTETIQEAMSGTYYLYSSTPCLLSENTNGAKVGLKNTVFPACSIQILLETTLNHWQDNQSIFMLDRGYNAVTGKVSTTRSIIRFPCDGSVPYCTFMVWTEGYYTNIVEKVTTVTENGLISQSPGKLYRDSYMACIVGYEKDNFLLIYLADTYNNMLYDDVDIGIFYVFTRQRIVPLNVIETINQEICRAGYNSKYLFSVDQTFEITEKFVFTDSFFEYSTQTTKSIVVPSVPMTPKPLPSPIPYFPPKPMPYPCPPNNGPPSTPRSFPPNPRPPLIPYPCPPNNCPPPAPCPCPPPIPCPCPPKPGPPPMPCPCPPKPGPSPMPCPCPPKPGPSPMPCPCPPKPAPPPMPCPCPPSMPCNCPPKPGPPSMPCVPKSLSPPMPYSSTRTINQGTFTSITKYSLPKICPSTWVVKTFDSQWASMAFQGVWYLQASTPMSLTDQTALYTGLFTNVYPCSNNRIIFKDTTPECSFDLNLDFYMIDSSFNLATQCIETTQSLLKSAYGSSSIYAIFHVITQKYYETPITDLDELIDDDMVEHPCDEFYERGYFVAIIGADDGWKEYMVFAIINQYDNVFCGNDNHILWVFTRDKTPDSSTYKKVFYDIKLSGLNPKYLIKIDQSIDLENVPTVNDDDIEGIIQTRTVTTTSTTTTSTDSDWESSTSVVTTTTTTVSTVEFTLRDDYVIPYDYDFYEYCGQVKILKGLKPTTISKALSGTWYVHSSTPCMIDDSDDARIGLFNTAFPACSLQLLIDTNMGPWNYERPTMMLDRCYNAITGEVTMTRSIIGSACDGSHPYGAFMVYNEGYCSKTIKKATTISPKGLIFNSPGKLYRDSYMACIVGYQPGDFLLIYVPSTYVNLLFGNADIGQFYVLTRKPIVSLDVIETIDQEICRIGYNPKYITSIDQSFEITDSFVFENSFFEFSYSKTTKSVSTQTSSSKSISYGRC